MLHQNVLSQIKRIQLSCSLPLNIIYLVVLSLILFFTNINSYAAQVDLEWDPNSESYLAGYKVYYGNSSRSYDSNIDVGNQTSYTVTGLLEGETKYFALTAYDTSGNESSYSGEVVYKPIMAMTSPAPGTELTTETVNFQWSDGDGVDSYWLGVGTSYESISNNPWGNIYTQSTGTNTSATVTGIPLNGNTVYVRLWYEIEGVWSFEDYTYGTTTVSTLDLTAPSTPTSPQATAIYNTKMNLSWNASTDNVGVTGYRIYRDGIQVADVTSTTYQDTGLKKNTTYVYTISAYDAAGNESSQSTPLVSNTKAPGRPTGMKIVGT